MRLIEHKSTIIDLSSTDTLVQVDLTAATPEYVNDLARAKRLKLLVSFHTNIVLGNTITFRLRAGHSNSASQQKSLFMPIDSVTSVYAPDRQPKWVSGDIILTPLPDTPAAGDLHVLTLWVASDALGGADDVTTTIDTYLYELDDVRSIDDTDVTLTNNLLNVNASNIGGNEPYDSANFDDLKDLMEADWVIDSTTDPAQWKLVFTKRGTTEVLLTKDLADIAGNPIISTSTKWASQEDA